jgi:hypothetical protein
LISDFYNNYSSVLQGLGSTQSTLTSTKLLSDYTTLDTSIGDLNNDGYDDMGFGHYGYVGYHPTQGNISGAGAFGVVLGAATLPFITAINVADWFVQGAAPSDTLGWDADSLDVNGDGHLDLALSGRTGYQEPVLFYGPISTGSFDVDDAEAWFTGHTVLSQGVANGGDLNNDGFDDLLVGSTSDSYGGVYLYLGTEL